MPSYKRHPKPDPSSKAILVMALLILASRMDATAATIGFVLVVAFAVCWMTR